MSKNKLHWLWLCSGLAVLFLVAVIIYPRLVFKDILFISLNYIVIDGFALVIGYAMLRKISVLASCWKFVVYTDYD
jgi:hypothetical protein